MLLTVIKGFVADFAKVGPASAGMRAWRTLRMAKRPHDVRFLESSPAVVAHRNAVAKHDVFFPISHRSFLCKYFEEEQRLAAARQSYGYIDTHFNPADFSELMSPGKVLWKSENNGQSFEIRLMFGNHNMYEGSLSVAFFIDDKHVGVMSFSVVDGTLLGEAPGPQLLLCRNQTTSDRWYQKPLQDAFKHIALPYMMIAAVAGIAESFKLGAIYAVTEDGHPHGEAKYVDLMRGSYSGFWEKYNAVPAGRGLMRISLPLESTPLEQVSANHRRRAKGRREVMTLITNAVKQSYSTLVRATHGAVDKPVQIAAVPAPVLAPLALGACEIVASVGGEAGQNILGNGALNILG